MSKSRQEIFKTQLQHAREGTITPRMVAVARDEGLDPELIMAELAAGRLIIPSNKNHLGAHPIGIGVATRCKVNANLGTSPSTIDPQMEVRKARLAVELGADTIMDLSTGGDLPGIRGSIMKGSNVVLGTVPIYEAASGVESVVELGVEDLLSVVERQARDGVDYMTIHAALLADHVALTHDRMAGIVSRGGSLMACWTAFHSEENPFYSNFDRLLDICRRHDVSLSLGDGLRPGCLADAGDSAQMAELEVMGHLVERCWDAGVQVMVEGPGHVPLDQVRWQVQRAAELCHGAPFYVLGPIVTDLAPGYDHITSAIGGAVAAWSGASMLCYVTPSEHLGLPRLDDVRKGVVAARIAAHAGDIARGRSGARQADDAISIARRKFDWDTQFRLCLDPHTARSVRTQQGTVDDNEHCCTMCGPNLCAVKLTDDLNESTGRAAG